MREFALRGSTRKPGQFANRNEESAGCARRHRFRSKRTDSCATVSAAGTQIHTFFSRDTFVTRTTIDQKRKSTRSSKNSAPPQWPFKPDHPTQAYLDMLLSMRPLGLCTDIDGTISLVAPTVEAAVLLPGVAELLARAVGKFDVVATISGRGVEDQKRMIGVDGVVHIGHHGYEWEELDTSGAERVPYILPEAAPYQADVAAALDEIEAELAPQI